MFDLGFSTARTLWFQWLISCEEGFEVENKPDYRRIRRYYKTSGQYWKERNRRKQVLIA